MTRASSKDDIVAAGLEAVAFQTRDLLDAMARDMAVSGLPELETVRADGGMTANRWFMQRLADILQKPVECASMAETTALGAAYIAGQAIGFYGDDTALGAHRVPVKTFVPEMGANESAD
jgi:glycerol kinase